MIYRHREKYSISEMCRFFGVSRSGYYGYVKRMEIPAKDLPLAEKIRECQAACRNSYGYRRVHIWLERHGIHHNPKTVLRVMNKYCQEKANSRPSLFFGENREPANNNPSKRQHKSPRRIPYFISDSKLLL